MPVIDIHLNNHHSVGLGDNLCLLSTLNNLPHKVKLYVSNDHQTYNRLSHLAKILRIEKGNLEILESGSNGDFPNTGWPIKLFNDYYKPFFVNVNGQILRTNSTKDKRCIAIAGFFSDPPSNHNNEWPWCKHRPIEYWAKIFAWLHGLGYEVITVDNAGFDLEDKIELLVKNCRAIVSYEGGMAHLAHMLRIPCFLIDWKHPSPSTTLGDFHCDFVHYTSSVHIVRDDNELFSWDYDMLTGRIAELSQGRTNNRLFDKSHTLAFDGPKIHGDLDVINCATQKKVLRAPSIFGDNPMTDLVNQYFVKRFYQNRLTHT